VLDRVALRWCCSMSPFATPERRVRRLGDRRLAGIALAVRRSLPQVIMSHLYPKSEIRVHVQIVTADGGELPAAITAATLALIDAGIALTDYVTCTSVAVVDKSVLVDPTQAEAGNAVAIVPVAILARSRRVVLCEATARIPLAVLKGAVEQAVDAAVGVFSVAKAAVHDHCLRQLSSRGLLTA
jgi:exosome complex component RRP41